MRIVKQVMIAVALSALLAMPLGGFVFGFTNATDCASWNVFARGFIGIVYLVLTPLYLGFVPKNEGGVGEPDNVWPCIFTGGVLIFIILMGFVFLYNSGRKHDA